LGGQYGNSSGSVTFDFVSSVPDSSSSVIDALVLGSVVFAGLSPSKRSGKRQRFNVYE
jgi:hypothetical protein